MKNFSGPFSKDLTEHILLKQSIGYNYNTEECILVQFDNFTKEMYPDAKSLTKEITVEWCSKRSYESKGNQASRVSALRQFTLYLDRIGKPAWVIPKCFCPKGDKYIPHIYTSDELQRFFRETDKCHVVSICPYRHLVMPLFFRLIYSCGLRCSEARLLKINDVDFENGILTIRESKNDNSRLVPMTEDMHKRCIEYFNSIQRLSYDGDWFFPGRGNRPLTLGNVYKNFRKFLFNAGIPHRGRGQGPRVHDFRHTYACNCLKKWISDSKDLNVYLPILKTYMGHNALEDTAYYLRLTADVYADISSVLDTKFNDIIPSRAGDSSD